MSKKFITSDTHFFHRSIRKFCPASRQGDDEVHMTELMIEAWNNKVAPNDLVYHLGDVSFGKKEETKDVLHRLNGNIILILGNHDNEENMKQMKRFDEVTRYKEIRHNGERCILFHYPIFEWDQLHRGTIHFYGHVHGRGLPMPEGRSCDVGIDTRTDMAPYSLDEIVEQMLGRPIRCHH